MPNFRPSKKYSQRKTAVTDNRVLRRLDDAEKEIIDDPNPYRDDRYIIDDVVYSTSPDGILITFSVTERGLEFLSWRDMYDS